MSREGSCSWFRRYLLSVKNLSVVRSEREFHWGFCNYIFLIWYILSIYCVKSETSCLVLIYRGYQKRKHPFWRDRFIPQGEVAHLLNQSASMEQPISFFLVYFCLCFVLFCCGVFNFDQWFFCVCFCFAPHPALLRRVEVRGSCHHPLLWGGRCGGQGGMVQQMPLYWTALAWAEQAGRAVPRDVLSLYLCKLLCFALPETVKHYSYCFTFVPSHLQLLHPTIWDVRGIEFSFGNGTNPPTLALPQPKFMQT